MLFVDGTPDQLAEKVKECLDISQMDSKYMIGPGCQIPLMAPLENIKHFIDFSHRYGAR